MGIGIGMGVVVQDDIGDGVVVAVGDWGSVGSSCRRCPMSVEVRRLAKKVVGCGRVRKHRHCRQMM